MTANDQGGLRVGRAITLGNFISPLLTVCGLGIPALLWAGKVDTRVEGLGVDIKTVRSEMADVKASAQTTASTLIGINYTISEGLKNSMIELTRRVTNLEAINIKQAEEIQRLQIELATIKRASEPRR